MSSFETAVEALERLHKEPELPPVSEGPFVGWVQRTLREDWIDAPGGLSSDDIGKRIGGGCGLLMRSAGGEHVEVFSYVGVICGGIPTRGDAQLLVEEWARALSVEIELSEVPATKSWEACYIVEGAPDVGSVGFFIDTADDGQITATFALVFQIGSCDGAADGVYTPRGHVDQDELISIEEQVTHL